MVVLTVQDLDRSALYDSEVRKGVQEVKLWTGRDGTYTEQFWKVIRF